ncbi:MAG: acyl carrier protein [Candidatus Thiodiazotropha sp.]
MNSDEIKNTILEVLVQIVPELEPATLDAQVSFRDQFEIDSIDYLNVILTLEKRLQIRIPEVDYPRLSSLQGCMSYLEKQLNP